MVLVQAYGYNANMFLLTSNLPSQTIYFIIMALVQIPIFTSLGTYVVSQRPRYLLSWAFWLMCAANVIGLATSLFMIGTPNLLPTDSPFLLRLKWAAAPFFGATIYHIYSYYFPETWWRFVRRSVLFVYATAVVLAILTLSTRWTVSGLIINDNQIHPNIDPGPLFSVTLGVNSLVVILAGGLLLYTYFTSASNLRKSHIRELLVPLLPLLVLPITLIPTMFTDSQAYWITRLSYIVLLIALLFYARNILRQGHFVGQAQSMKQLAIVALMSVVVLICFVAIFAVDSWMYQFLPIRIPLILSLLMIIVISAQPALGRFVVRQLRRFQESNISQQEMTAANIATKLEQVQNPQEIYQSLLEYACESLSVTTGFLALIDSEGGQFVVKTTYKTTAVSAGQQLSALPAELQYPNLLAATTPWLQDRPEWQETNFVSPIFDKEGPLIGLLALGERSNRQPFQQGDTAYIQGVCRRLAQVQRMTILIEEQQSLLAQAQAQTDEIVELQTQLKEAPLERSPVLKIHTLGPLQIERENSNGSPVTWASSKEKIMLGHLLWCGNRGATREELSAMLWPDFDEERARNVFYVTMYKLRQTLDPNRTKHSQDYISNENGRYQLNADKPIWIDANHFEQLIESSEPDDWRAAVSLYRGAYLEDVSTEMPSDFNFTQRHYEALYESGLRRLIDCLPAEEAYSYMQMLLALVPTDDTANKKLIHYYLSQNRPDLARHLVAQWRSALAEMGIAPTPDTLAFWHKIESNGSGNPPS